MTQKTKTLDRPGAVSVVLGGAGFIGSHLCDFLVERGHRVIAIDNLITGNRNNLAELTKTSLFSFVEQDVTSFINVDGPVHFVFHLASPASPVDYLQLPIQTLKVGAMGTHNALGLARAKKATFLLASTSEAYGDPLVHPQPESYWGNVNPIGPRGVYDEAKRFAEAMTMAYHRYHGIDTRIVRIFNTYGPRMRPNDGRVVPTLIRQSLRGEALTVFGEGKQTRSFCYVSDLILGLYQSALTQFHEPVNLGNPREMTVMDFAVLIKAMTGTDAPITHKPLPADDPKTRQPDIRRARELLRWEPVVTLEEGLTKTIDYFKTLPDL